jgi:hypothetical protein
MKKMIILFISMIFCFNNLLSQSERYYYFYTPEQIESNIKNKRHEVCNVLNIDERRDSTFYIGEVVEFGTVGGIHPTVIQAISFGKFRYYKDIILCHDKRLNRTYRFKKINEYVIEALNHTAVFVKGTKLYLHLQEDGKANSFYAFYKPEDLITSNYWKTGIRNGVFTMTKTKPWETTLIYYENNLAIDSVRYNHTDSTNLVLRDQFLQRYYNQ